MLACKSYGNEDIKTAFHELEHYVVAFPYIDLAGEEDKSELDFIKTEIQEESIERFLFKSYGTQKQRIDTENRYRKSYDY